MMNDQGGKEKRTGKCESLAFVDFCCLHINIDIMNPFSFDKFEKYSCRYRGVSVFVIIIVIESFKLCS
jgi:hypothetical protein